MAPEAQASAPGRYTEYFYLLNLGVFTLGNSYFIYKLYRKETEATNVSLASTAAAEEAITLHDGGDDELDLLDVHEKEDIVIESSKMIRKFRYDFFLPYALAVAADWLQGPQYVNREAALASESATTRSHPFRGFYAIYKYEKGIPEKLVAALYATGFLAAAVSAYFVGEFADRYGRKRACLVYCVVYFLTCASMLCDNLMVLFVGRIFGGVGTTLLFSVFETWMITEYHERGMHKSGLELNTMFGHMTSLSGIVAIVSGVIGDVLVENLGSRIWPFLAAQLCCAFGAATIWKLWNENYGATTTITASGYSLGDFKSGVQTIIKDTKILVLVITSTVFEGTMYLFVFFWSAALRSARSASASSNELPFGIIFSSFMCAMMAGSAYCTLQNPSHNTQGALKILKAAILITSCCLSATVMLHHEQLVFWLFCALEACVGVYFPNMASLKSEAIEDGVRGRVYSIIRLPLSLFVVVAHSLDREGDGHRNKVFLTCAALLILAYGGLQRQLL